MRVLLDSHVLLWMDGTAELNRIPPRVKLLLDSELCQPVISHASIWEIAVKSATGKLILSKPIDQMLASYQDSRGLTLLPITLPHILAQETLPRHHGDPFDRMIIAQSLIESIPIVTADAAFDRYGVARVWD